MVKLRNIFGATPIEPDEIDGLIPGHIVTQNELNEWEQANIIEAHLWLNNKNPKIVDILTQPFVKKLHQKMFMKTWRWSGKFRKTDKNIGVDWREIPIHLKNLFDDINFQILHKTYSLDEIAARFHHRLVFIHPFVNGNGRISRIMTDLLLISQKQTTFSWGRENLEQEGDVRKIYIMALHAADKYDYLPLLNFVRT